MQRDETASAQIPLRRAATATSRWLPLIGVVLSFYALSAARSVLIPLAFAVLLLPLFTPLERRLRALSGAVSAILVCLIIYLGLVAAFAALFTISTDMLADRLSGRTDAIQGLMDRGKSWLAAQGLSFGDGTSSSTVTRLAKRGLELSTALTTGVLLAGAFLLLMLYERPRFEDRLHQHFGRRHFTDLLSRVGTQMRRYIVVRTVLGALNGVAAAIATWALGIELFWLWGVLTFGLNYIPTVGSVIATVPPVVFAYVQFGGWQMPLATLAVIGGIQLVMGNWIDPLAQGRVLSLSPTLVLVSVVFWGIIWGIPGAFLGVPATMILVMFGMEYDGTRPYADLLRGANNDRDRGVS